MSALLRGWCRFLLALVLASAGSVFAATCGPATTQGTAPADFRDYCWLDFSGYVNSTATSKNGQGFSFTLPDGTTVGMNVKVTSGATMEAKAVPSWTGSAFGNSAFKGIPNKPVLYTSVNGAQVTVTISGITVDPPGNGAANYSIVIADGESTNTNESLTFTTNGGNWQQIAKVPGVSGSAYPSLPQNYTTTVKETGTTTGDVGSYVFRSDNNPTTITAQIDAGGLQGIIIGMRYASISVVSEFAGARYNPPDQFTYGLKTGATAPWLVSQKSTGTALDGFPVAAMPTVAASYPFMVTQEMAPGSTGTLANYTTSLTCVNAKTGGTTPMPKNLAASSYTFQNLAYGDSVLCTFTNTPIFNQIVGTVYNDLNHNAVQDGSETGAANIAWVKAAQVVNGACAAPAAQVVQVTAANGAYTLPNLPQGNYCVILDNNALASDVTANPPPGWIPTQNASGVVQVSVPAGSPTPPPQVFGLYNGARLTGTVFADTGVGSGTPNNGTKDGTEPGLAGVAVTAKNASSSFVASATTGGDGSFTIWVPAGTTTAVTVTPAIPAGYFATGGSVGTTGGTFSRPTVTFTPSSGTTSYTGVGFGFATPNTFAPNGAQTAQPGSVVFYAHTYEAGSGGQVTFSLAGASNPASPTWNAVLYLDSSCNASLDNAEPLVAAAITVRADDRVCILVKQFVPAGIAYGAINTVTVTATFSYTNASPALSSTLTATDTTTAGEPSALNLKKMVNNVTRAGPQGTSVIASPGEVLQYTLTAQNNGSSTLSTLVINDATPAFTTFVAAACPGTLPAGITGCTIASQPAVGAPGSVKWTFTGSLGAGGTVVVTYQVKLTE